MYYLIFSALALIISIPSSYFLLPSYLGHVTFYHYLRTVPHLFLVTKDLGIDPQIRVNFFIFIGFFITIAFLLANKKSNSYIKTIS